MGMNHTHKGVESNGRLKSHPVNRKHKDKVAQKYHLLELGLSTKSKTPKVKKTKLHKLEETIPVDIDGYLAVDLNTIKHGGIRILNVKKGKVMFADGNVKGIQVDK